MPLGCTFGVPEKYAFVTATMPTSAAPAGARRRSLFGARPRKARGRTCPQGRRPAQHRRGSQHDAGAAARVLFGVAVLF